MFKNFCKKLGGSRKLLINSPIATTIAPIPVDINAILKTFMAVDAPPVARVCWAEAHVSPIFSMKAASSIISKDTASDRAASEFEDLACILDPLTSCSDSLLFSTASTFNHDGKLS